MTLQCLLAAVHMRMPDKKIYHPRNKAAIATKHTPNKVHKWLEYLSQWPLKITTALCSNRNTQKTRFTSSAPVGPFAAMQQHMTYKTRFKSNEFGIS